MSATAVPLNATAPMVFGNIRGEQTYISCKYDRAKEDMSSIIKPFEYPYYKTILFLDDYRIKRTNRFEKPIEVRDRFERENYIKTYQLLLNSFIENSKKESVAKEFRPMFDQIAFQFAKLPIIDYAIEVLENEKYLGFNLGVKGDYIILANKYLDDDDDEVFFSVSYEGDPFIVNSMKVEDLVLTMQEVIQKSVLL